MAFRRLTEVSLLSKVGGQASNFVVISLFFICSLLLDSSPLLDVDSPLPPTEASLLKPSFASAANFKDFLWARLVL